MTFKHWARIVEFTIAKLYVVIPMPMQTGEALSCLDGGGVRSTDCGAERILFRGISELNIIIYLWLILTSQNFFTFCKFFSKLKLKLHCSIHTH